MGWNGRCVAEDTVTPGGGERGAEGNQALANWAHSATTPITLV